MCVATELSVVYDWSNTELIEYAWLQAQNCDINFVSIFGSNSSLLIKVKTVPLYRVKNNNNTL